MANLAGRIYGPCLRLYRGSVKRFGPLHAVCYGVGSGLVSLTSAIVGFRTNVDDPLYWRLALATGSHEPATRRLFAEIVRPGMTVVDIGAHIGYYTTQFSRLVGPSGRVIAFEPQPRNYEILQRNVSGRANVTLVQRAASDRQETVALFDDMPDTGGASLRRDADRTEQMRGLASPEDIAPRLNTAAAGGVDEVTTVRVDDTLAELDLRNVDVVKMDIEGAEMAALSGMEGVLRDSARLQIVLELNPPALRTFDVEPEDLCAWLGERSFALHRVADDGSLDPLPDADAVTRLIAELEQSGDVANLLARRA